MIFFKILGIVLAVLAVLIALLLFLRVKIIISYDPEGRLKYYAKYLFFSTENGKKQFDVMGWLQKKLELELPKVEEESEEDRVRKGIYEKVATVVLLVTMLADEFVWLLKRLRLDKLHVVAICTGDDAAESATDYGLVCSAVYPLVGYLMANANAKKDAEDVQIGCDFDGEGYFEFELTVSVRLVYVIYALLKAFSDIVEVADETSTENTTVKESTR